MVGLQYFNTIENLLNDLKNKNLSRNNTDNGWLWYSVFLSNKKLKIVCSEII